MLSSFEPSWDEGAEFVDDDWHEEESDSGSESGSLVGGAGTMSVSSSPSCSSEEVHGEGPRNSSRGGSLSGRLQRGLLDGLVSQLPSLTTRRGGGR